MDIIKNFLKNHNVKNLNRFAERILSAACILVCIGILASFVVYTEQHIKNSGFRIKNQNVELSYNLLADSLTELGYNVNMVSNNDNTYSIVANYTDKTITFEVDVKIDNDGNLLQNDLNSKILLVNIKDAKYKYDRNSAEVFNYYIMFNKTLNIFNKTIELDDFEKVFDDANNYDEFRHGRYESKNNYYEIYKDTKYIYINSYLKK